MLRSGARPGDEVAITGRLGWAAAGLTVLSRGFRSPAALVGAYRVPEPPLAAGVTAAASGATSMIDVSDGLVADLGHIAEASGVSINIRPAALDVNPRLVEVASALGKDPLDSGAHGRRRPPAGRHLPARCGATAGLAVDRLRRRGRRRAGRSRWTAPDAGPGWLGPLPLTAGSRAFAAGAR